MGKDNSGGDVHTQPDEAKQHPYAFCRTKIKHLRSSAPSDLNEHRQMKKMQRSKKKVDIKEARRVQREKMRATAKRERNRKRRQKSSKKRGERARESNDAEAEVKTGAGRRERSAQKRAREEMSG